MLPIFLPRVDNYRKDDGHEGACQSTATHRFHELARLVPHLVTPENKRIKRYIYGLAPQIRDMVTATEPTTIQKAMQKASTPTYEAIRNGSMFRLTFTPAYFA
ncbi:hypothetical protein Tco_1355374 [Tanacetum coccineum]